MEKNKLDKKASPKNRITDEKVLSGNRLKKLREEAGISSQEKLAEIVGCSSKTIADAEAGLKLLSSKNGIKLAQEFGYSLDWIYGISDVSNQENRHWLIDIRNLIQIQHEQVYINIRGSLFRYLKKLGEVQSQCEAEGFSKNEQKRMVKELDRQYRFSISKGDYYAMIDEHEFMERLNDALIYIP